MCSSNAVGGIAEIINDYGFVNVDFEDVRTRDGRDRQGHDGHGHRQRPRSRPALPPSRAVACPLLEGIDLRCQGRAGAGHGGQVAS